MDDLKECRVEFEEWAAKRGLTHIERLPSGDYDDAYLTALYEAWDAAWNRRAVPQANAEQDAKACAMQAARDIEHERLRQHWQEGWTDEKDDQYVEGELSRAAACYASHASAQQRVKVPEAAYQAAGPLPQNYFGWPWDTKWWKPQNPRRDLVKAGALILAEIERLDRAASKTTPSSGEGEA